MIIAINNPYTKEDDDLSLIHVFKQIHPVLLRLACDIDEITNQLFTTLLYQYINWLCLSKTNMNENQVQSTQQNQIRIIFINHLFHIISHPIDASLRTIASTCLSKCIISAIQSSNKQVLNLLMNKIFDLLLHPNIYKKHGAATTINLFYHILRQHQQIVIQYSLKLLYTLLYALSEISNEIDHIHSINEILQAIQHCEKIILHAKYYKLLSYKIEPNKHQWPPISLYQYFHQDFYIISTHLESFILYLFCYGINAIQDSYRRECWRLLEIFTSNEIYIGYHTLDQYIDDFIQQYDINEWIYILQYGQLKNPAETIDIAMNQFQVLEQQQPSLKFNIKCPSFLLYQIQTINYNQQMNSIQYQQVINWLQSLVTALDCYYYVIKNTTQFTTYLSYKHIIKESILNQIEYVVMFILYHHHHHQIVKKENKLICQFLIRFFRFLYMLLHKDVTITSKFSFLTNDHMYQIMYQLLLLPIDIYNVAIQQHNQIRILQAIIYDILKIIPKHSNIDTMITKLLYKNDQFISLLCFTRVNSTNLLLKVQQVGQQDQQEGLQQDQQATTRSEEELQQDQQEELQQQQQLALSINQIHQAKLLLKGIINILNDLNDFKMVLEQHLWCQLDHLIHFKYIEPIIRHLLIDLFNCLLHFNSSYTKKQLFYYLNGVYAYKFYNLFKELLSSYMFHKYQLYLDEFYHYHTNKLIQNLLIDLITIAIVKDKQCYQKKAIHLTQINTFASKLISIIIPFISSSLLDFSLTLIDGLFTLLIQINQMQMLYKHADYHVLISKYILYFQANYLHRHKLRALALLPYFLLAEHQQGPAQPQGQQGQQEQQQPQQEQIDLVVAKNSDSSHQNLILNHIKKFILCKPFSLTTRSYDVCKPSENYLLYKQYKELFLHLLQALQISKSFELLKILLPILREQQHQYFSTDIQRYITLYLKNYLILGQHQQTKVFLNQIWNLYQDINLDTSWSIENARKWCITSLLLPILNQCALSIMIEFYTMIYPYLIHSLQTYQIKTNQKEQDLNLMNIEICYLIISLFYSRIKSKDKLLTLSTTITNYKVLIKLSHKHYSSWNNHKSSYQRPLLQSYLSCNQAAYQCLCQILLLTQTNSKFFHKLCLSEHTSQVLWANVIDINTIWQFTLDIPSHMLHKQVIIDEENKPQNTQQIKIDKPLTSYLSLIETQTQLIKEQQQDQDIEPVIEQEKKPVTSALEEIAKPEESKESVAEESDHLSISLEADQINIQHSMTIFWKIINHLYNKFLMNLKISKKYLFLFNK